VKSIPSPHSKVMTILQQPIPKKPPILARVFKKTNYYYFEAVGIFLFINEDFLGVGNLNFSRSLKDKRG
jgi:hypothetical protein